MNATWLQLPTIDLGAGQGAVGESHYQAALETVSGGRNGAGTRVRIVTAQLVPEPTNPHDPEAIRVEIGGHHVAFVLRDNAHTRTLVQRMTAEGTPATCRAELIGGWDRGPADTGLIGVSLLTGARPRRWTGKRAFLPDRPFHYAGTITAIPGTDDTAAAAIKASTRNVHLAASGHALAVSHGDTWFGHILDSPPLVALVAHVTSQGLPPTATLHKQFGGLAVRAADPNQIATQLDGPDFTDLTRARSRPDRGQYVCQRCGLQWLAGTPIAAHGEPGECPECGSNTYAHPL